MSYVRIKADVTSNNKASRIGVASKIRPAIKKMPQIKKVHFNPPLTIVIWEDGTKTFVKADEEYEDFDYEKGLAMAISKKYLGNKYSYYDKFKSYIPKDEPCAEEDSRFQHIITGISEAMSVAKGTSSEEYDHMEYGCWNCKYHDRNPRKKPCRSCRPGNDKWTEKNEGNTCSNCKYEDTNWRDEPCESCDGRNNNFEPRPRKKTVGE